MPIKIEKLHTEQAELVAEALKENNGYCPCKAIKTKDTKCMCKEFREMEIGICHCGLYQKIKI